MFCFVPVLLLPAFRPAFSHVPIPRSVPTSPCSFWFRSNLFRFYFLPPRFARSSPLFQRIPALFGPRVFPLQAPFHLAPVFVSVPVPKPKQLPFYWSPVFFPFQSSFQTILVLYSPPPPRKQCTKTQKRDQKRKPTCSKKRLKPSLEIFTHDPAVNVH